MSAPDPAASSVGPPRYVGLAVAGAALLALGGAAAFYFASQMRRPPPASDAFRVTITAHGCEPATLSVPAGRQTFEIVNASDRPVEWEALDGVMVVEERENIAPGFRALVSARIAEGDYEMICGLLSNPHGALRVTPSAEGAIASAAPTLRAFLGPLAEYQFYVGVQSGKLVDSAQALADAVKAGDLDEARTAYQAARAPYKRLETVAYQFSDLVNRLNPSADYLAGREADPAFTGFHRIAYGLYAKNSLDGLTPVADHLVADATDLQEKLRGPKLTPADLVHGASRLSQQLASGRIASGEDAYSKTDLDDVAANLESIGKILELTGPVVQKSAPEVTEAAQKALTQAQGALERLKDGDGYRRFDAVDAWTRAELAKTFAVLADALAKLEPTMDVRS